MSGRTEQDHQWFNLPPDAGLETYRRNALEHAVDGHRKNLGTYESLQNANEVVSTEYGDRVLYELIQNAHDAHQPGDQGKIEVNLAIRSESEGTLYIANGGGGFRWEDVDAIMNLAKSAKKVGEGIGNKGLGFRSVKMLTDDVRIFSRRGTEDSKRFDGYCFRFAERGEIEKELLHTDGVDTDTARAVAQTVPRYSCPVPLAEQPDEVSSYADRGYASVIVLPLCTKKAVDLASQQVEMLADLDMPLLLFLNRIADFRINVTTSDGSSQQHRLRRDQKSLESIPGIADCHLYDVRVGDGDGENQRFLVVQRKVDKERVINAVERSISMAPQIKPWLKWKGEPTLSVAVGLSSGALTKGRLYNFLPMGDAAASPLFGHLDAPFFAGMDRRNANFTLPLNEELMTAAAEACAHAARYLIQEASMKIPQLSIFDLVAWTGNHAGKLDAALKGMESSLAGEPIVPVVAGRGVRWASLAETRHWPVGEFSSMSASNVAKRTYARLVSPEIKGERLRCLEDMAKRGDCNLTPSGEDLAEWSERFAHYLYEKPVKPPTWLRFYEDLPCVFRAACQDLKALAGKKIILDSSGNLQAAGRNGDAPYVRDKSTRGRSAKDGVPLPPSRLMQGYRFVKDEIKLWNRPDTLSAFIDAGLVRPYDPVEALAGLGSAIGRQASDNLRQEALTWAFRVWCSNTDNVHVKEALRSSQLQVPILSVSGRWKPATEAAFSSSWTPTGDTLWSFLEEAKASSPDCQRAWDALLLDFEQWPPVTDGTKEKEKEKWVKFLKLLGVVDGLQPITAALQERNEGYNWKHLIRRGKSELGLDKGWCEEVEELHPKFGHQHGQDKLFKYPRTLYEREGEAWMLPGQIEHAELSELGKNLFCELIFIHLKEYDHEYLYGDKYLKFKVGRYERSYRREWDEKDLPTPLATFLRSKAWIAVSNGEETCFRKARECWTARTKRVRPPQFIERISSDKVSEMVEGNKEFAELVFGNTLGLRDWHAPETAAERLQALAAVAPNLGTYEREDFRNEYKRAWREISERKISLPEKLKLAVICHGKLETLSGNSENAPTVIVTQNAHEPAARALSSSGYTLLEIGKIGKGLTDEVIKLLAETDIFKPRGIGGDGVQFLVNGKHFSTSSKDPLLFSLERRWLSEVVLLGYEIMEGKSDQDVSRKKLEQRIRAIRVRDYQSISLLVDDKEVSSQGAMQWYGLEHPERPTLILSENVRLSWRTLSRGLAKDVQLLLGPQFQFFEKLILRLNAQIEDSDSLHPPSKEALAEVLECSLARLKECRATLRTDLNHVLHLLTPVVAYFGDVELARKLERDAESGREQFDVSAWLESSFPQPEPASADLIEACKRAENRAALRKELKLDYGKFNHALQELGEPLLSNKDELRSQYEGHLRQMKPGILERLRRRYAADFQKGRDLSVYVDRKSLEFLEFDSEWILTMESLDKEIVDAHVKRLLEKILGEDKEISLSPSCGLLEKNRKSVRNFASRAVSVVGTWCLHNRVVVPDPWQSKDPQAVTRHLENSGLLDFDPIEDQKQIPALCHRAGCWPKGMPQTLETGALGLDSATVEAETKDRQKEHEQKITKERSKENIDFAGRSLDPRDPGFAQVVQKLAEHVLADGDWFERSRHQPELAEFNEMDGVGRRPGGGTGARKGRGRQQLTDDQRGGMGIVSEWLALEYLRRRHVEAVDETCWVSSNRTHYCGGDEGDDSAGYDFRVQTPEAEWLYEVKSSLADDGEFEMTPNEMRVAASVPAQGRRKYRILYVSFVFLPDRWRVRELPNPMAEESRNHFKQVSQGSVRFQFKISSAR